MDLSDLKVFEAVSRLGSMSRAAKELHTVQSNVTARIRVLEEELGVPLFQRHARGVTPTPAGRRILPYVAKISKLVADARSAARDDGTPSGTLQLGSLETTTALRLSPVLVSFAKANPKVRLAITTGTTTRLLSDVLEYRLDGAFVAGPVSHPDLQHETFFREELVLVTAPSVRTPKDLISIDDLKTIVFQIGCSYRQRLETSLAEMGIAVAQPQEFGSLDAIISCVSAGLGVTLMPRAVVASALRDGRVAAHKLPLARGMVETVFVRRKDVYVSSAMKAFFDLIRTHPESRRAA
ncbi:LysR family transcriptional regulator [Bradyrhizobium barranii]|uniref:LysR family transcriptional regulator n=1 Tax=Bradyrhizobium barranii TaxID=2992140 RepID=A0ABY3QR10_9BRAD|nr:LysR family transcriptional regulator [Bradyrhizobium japonicum]UFW88454.1 LysR family transcriptional regulator [Bradyrhizobium japonicum]